MARCSVERVPLRTLPIFSAFAHTGLYQSSNRQIHHPMLSPGVPLVTAKNVNNHWQHCRCSKLRRVNSALVNQPAGHRAVLVRSADGTSLGFAHKSTSLHIHASATHPVLIFAPAVLAHPPAIYLHGSIEQPHYATGCHAPLPMRCLQSA
jgi:hypothetical protein